ncbi:DMT family transporter [Salipiger marinus]|jgi:drug/metabolite transporter (DMT)-like permease|uniref:EamA domain-containing membrane protein RarD n=1 Tax=Salipiger marinus TaxID=555512 RepID=A0A1G8NNI3_9RHOB|nr:MULTISPECIES: DMT family transporter [Salipiger]HBM61475.1 EamA/RhaT family transporter [Citreicella sp.]MCD1617461.1 DMT family transporter [Salipiger manganoxidans]MEB3417517.1 DMT family transporter [Salipiger manganoxidans]SDI81851.1 EamA domain-containing membrane protein RarD [Salipiger marinus]HBS98326.1 EamA/RhaT family transporter [Citreicella sp.]|tara:strand:- start:44 stop:961 length:918 start_codon:yes stop_codon:yes gene_type:complete
MPSPLLGIALKLASVVLFVVMSALIKAASDEVPTGQTVFFRSFFAMPVILVWILWRRELSSGLRVKSVSAHFLRGIVGAGAMGFNFAALGLLPLPEVTALSYAGPLLTVIFAAVLLGEKVRIFRMSAVLMGLVGVVIVMWPLLTVSDVNRAVLWGVIFMMASAVLRALVQIHIRRMVATEQTAAIVFYFSLTATLLSLLTIPFGWVMPGPADLALLVGSGLIGGVAQICLTAGYRHGEAALLAPFDYASILVAILIGYVVFSDVPTVWMLVGSAVVIASGVAIILREHALGVKSFKARQGMTPQG